MRRRRPHAFGSFADILQRPRPCEWYVGFLVLRLPTIRPNLRVTNLMKRHSRRMSIGPGRGIQFLGAFRPGAVPAGSAFLVISKCAKLSKMTPMPRMKNPSPSLLRPGTFAKIDTPRGSSRVRRPATSANRLASWPLTCAELGKILRLAVTRPRSTATLLRGMFPAPTSSDAFWMRSRCYWSNGYRIMGARDGASVLLIKKNGHSCIFLSRPRERIGLDRVKGT